MVVLEYIDKHIITLFEGLKHYIKSSIVKQKNLISQFKNIICQKIKQTIKWLKWAVGGWTPTWNEDEEFNLFSVTNGMDTYEVNLQRHHCAFRKWALSGIPCVHAIVCILHNKTEVDRYVLDYYMYYFF